MLKIKDNVDLKELEKFGFEKKGSSWYGLNIRENTEESIDIAISLYAEPRCINISYYTKTFGKISSFTYDLDILFDLIQSGLVEKVEE